MNAPPDRWRARHGRDPEAELRRLNRHFQSISRRLDRATTHRRLDHWAQMSALAIIACVALYWAMVILSPWPPLLTLRHLAAAPNCDAARAIGLAPARRGEPGYWPRHDRDDDGVACEPWLGQKASFGRR